MGSLALVKGALIRLDAALDQSQRLNRVLYCTYARTEKGALVLRGAANERDWIVDPVQHLSQYILIDIAEFLARLLPRVHETGNGNVTDVDSRVGRIRRHGNQIRQHRIFIRNRELFGLRRGRVLETFAHTDSSQLIVGSN